MTETLALLIAAHFVADYPLQGDFLAKAKFDGPLRVWHLFGHSAIHGGAVTFVGGSRGLNICPLEHMSCAEEAIRGPDGLSASDKMIEAGGDVRSKMANARLIAAAPDLLEAAQAAYPSLRQPDGERARPHHDAWGRMRSGRRHGSRRPGSALCQRGHRSRGGSDMTPITLPTIPGTRLEADRAARDLFTNAGWIPSAIVILIGAAAAVACIGFGIEALVADHARWVAEARV